MKNELLKLSPNNLTFAGQIENMDTVWSNIGLVCITSRAEGLPMVALEAMYRGIPIISFDVGGMSQLIKHDYNGWLTKQNDIESISYYLKNWFDLASKTKNLIKNRCIQTIETSYSSKSVIPQITGIYNSLSSLHVK